PNHAPGEDIQRKQKLLFGLRSRNEIVDTKKYKKLIKLGFAEIAEIIEVFNRSYGRRIHKHPNRVFVFYCGQNLIQKPLLKLRKKRIFRDNIGFRKREIKRFSFE